MRYRETVGANIRALRKTSFFRNPPTVNRRVTSRINQKSAVLRGAHQAELEGIRLNQAAGCRFRRLEAIPGRHGLVAQPRFFQPMPQRPRHIGTGLRFQQRGSLTGMTVDGTNKLRWDTAATNDWVFS